MKTEVKDNCLVITIPLQAPQSSAIGKTKVIAKTGGFMGAGISVNGKPVSINITATIPN